MCQKPEFLLLIKQQGNRRREREMVNSGLAFHCHHDKLFEYVYDYQERVEYIKSRKLKDEQELRLRLFKLIPDNRLPKDLIKADATWVKARATWDKADAARNKADAIYDKAIAKHTDFLTQLHAELCPDCPWDGETIFKGARDGN